MAVSAAIKITQGVTTAPAGEALLGDLDATVTFSNGDDMTGPVVWWKWEVVDVPPGSSVATGTVTEGAIASMSLVPDVRGGYLVRLTTKDSQGAQATDLRCFGVLEESGRFVPPFLANASALNFDGQERGWAKYMEEWLHAVDQSGSYQTVDIDLSAQPDQTFATNTTYTFAGYTWAKLNSAGDAVAMANDEGNGLVCQPGAVTDFYDATDTLPRLRTSMLAMFPGASMFSPSRMWGHIANNSGANENFKNAVMSIEVATAVALAYQAHVGFDDTIIPGNVGPTLEVNNKSSRLVLEPPASSAFAAFDVWCLDLPMGLAGPVRLLAGTWDDGFPDFSLLRPVSSYVFNTGVNFASVDPSLVYFALGALRAGSGTSYSVTWAAVRMQVKL
jgi:hypothetical protein